MNMKYTKAQVDLMNEIRMLWEQHGFWTREAIMSIVLELPNEEVIVQRLLKNPKDFGRALRPLYGDFIAARFSELLTDHLTIAAELVKASKAGDDKTAADAERRWYANADEIAFLLGSINPFWSQQEWRTMLHEHLGLVKAEAVAMLTQKFEDGIRIFDEIERQALEMADVMSMGIIKQFNLS
jgi:hypothetical protein